MFDVVLFMVVGDKENNDLNHNMISSLAPIPIGLAVFVSHLTLGQFTGCGINPARVLGAVIFEKVSNSYQCGSQLCARDNPGERKYTCTRSHTRERERERARARMCVWCVCVRVRVSVSRPAEHHLLRTRCCPVTHNFPSLLSP